MTARRIPFLSLVPGEDAADVECAIQRVIARGWFVLGPEVDELEATVAQHCGRTYGVGVSSGTDALFLALKALDLGPGDEIITTAMSWIATANAVANALASFGAKPNTHHRRAGAGLASLLHARPS